MTNYKEGYWNKTFSPIYVERAALEYPLTASVLEKLQGNTLVTVEHYKDVFNRPGQDFSVQKNSPKLILAVRRGAFMYEGADVCDHYGHTRFFYASQMMNCLYNCQYCYLRGVYDSANVVAFVNTADYFAAVDALLHENETPVYLSISYDADLLALEGLVGFIEAWADFSANRPALTLEARTKSAAWDAIAHVKPSNNMILSWTLSPEPVIKQYEARTPSLQHRLDSVCSAVAAGWRVRLCLDPVLLMDGWENQMHPLQAAIKSRVDLSALEGITVGGFRMSKACYKRILKKWPDSFIRKLPLVETAGVIRYSDADEAKIIAMGNELYQM